MIEWIKVWNSIKLVACFFFLSQRVIVYNKAQTCQSAQSWIEGVLRCYFTLRPQGDDISLNLSKSQKKGLWVHNIGLALWCPKMQDTTPRPPAISCSRSSSILGSKSLPSTSVLQVSLTVSEMSRSSVRPIMSLISNLRSLSSRLSWVVAEGHIQCSLDPFDDKVRFQLNVHRYAHIPCSCSKSWRASTPLLPDGPAPSSETDSPSRSRDDTELERLDGPWWGGKGGTFFKYTQVIRSVGDYLAVSHL